MTKKTTVLIFEDDQIIRQLYRTLFLKAGYDVRAFADAERVVEKVRAFHPGIVLIDILMPKIDGYEAIRLLRKTPEAASIPIAVLSNLGDRVSQQKSAYYGANAFFVKSDTEPHVLVDRIREVLSGDFQPIPLDPKIVEVIKAEEQAKKGAAGGAAT